ncbi:MAG: chiR [Cryobacterium sp.]|nr:chiR [Cryobacterium sp.]
MTVDVEGRGEAIRIILVDDQDLVRAGFRMVLEAAPGIIVVAEASDGVSAIKQTKILRPDVILMDIRMPGMDGVSATRAIIADDPAARIIVLTTFDLDEYAFGALSAGASGFLLKDVTPRDLLTSIHAVAAGDAALSSRVSRRMLELFSHRLPKPTPSDGGCIIDALTPRELEVLISIARGHSNAEISAALFLAESTVKTHVGRILLKLDLRDRVHAVIFAYEHGLVTT